MIFPNLGLILNTIISCIGLVAIVMMAFLVIIFVIVGIQETMDEIKYKIYLRKKKKED